MKYISLFIKKHNAHFPVERCDILGQEIYLATLRNKDKSKTDMENEICSTSSCNISDCIKNVNEFCKDFV